MRRLRPPAMLSLTVWAVAVTMARAARLPDRSGKAHWPLLASVLILPANILGRSPLMDGQVERFTALTRMGLYLPFIVGAAVALANGWQLPARRT